MAEWAAQRYEGDFLGGRLHGRGVMTLADGEQYEGDYRDDQQNGRGVYTWPDGAFYEGDFRAGKFDGRGVLTLASRPRYEGGWRDNPMAGQSTFTFLNPNGWTHEGTFRNWLQVGIHTATHRTTGRVERVRFNDAGVFVETLEVLSEGS